MFATYNTKIIFYLWYIVKNINNTGMLIPPSHLLRTNQHELIEMLIRLNSAWFM